MEVQGLPPELHPLAVVLPPGQVGEDHGGPDVPLGQRHGVEGVGLSDGPVLDAGALGQDARHEDVVYPEEAGVGTEVVQEDLKKEREREKKGHS